MNLLPDPEQTQLLDAAIDFLRNEAPVTGGESAAAARERMGRPFLSRIGALGWLGLGLAEADGGIGYSLAEEALVFREFGRHLVSPAILGAVLGARVAAAAGDTETVGAILSGEKLVAVTIGLREADIARKVSGLFQVLEADGADYVLFCDEAGAALLAGSCLAAADAGDCLDDRLSMKTIALAGADALSFVEPGQDDIYRRGVVLSAAMLAGVAEASRDAAVEYAKVRQQFGQAIGGFQAIKHKLSDMAVRCEAASASVFHAALSVRDALPTAALDAAAAKAFCAEAAIENASVSVQVHGGMGFTEQMTPHLYVKRSRVLDHILGDHRKQLAAVLAADAA